MQQNVTYNKRVKHMRVCVCVFKNSLPGNDSWPKYAVLCKLIYYTSYSWSNRVFKYQNFINIHYYIGYNECLKIKNLFYIHTEKAFYHCI